MKQVLIVIPYHDIYPPMNGGMLRCFHLLNQLAKYYQVTAIMHQRKDAFLKAVDHYPLLANCEIFSTADTQEPKDMFSLLPKHVKDGLRYRYWKGTWQGPADSNFLLYFPILSRLLKTRSFDCILLENLSTLNVAPTVRRLSPSAFIVYDAHNVDTLLARAMPNNMHTQHIEKAESSLSQLVDAVITCSEGDLREFRRMNKADLRGAVIPNGVELDPCIEFSVHKQQPDQLLFCGSLDYEPNQEGLLWFCRNVFPLLKQQQPSITLMVVGKGHPGDILLKALEQPGIVYYGMVESVAEFYKKASVAIVPLFTGSGTRLKVLEAMGKKVPVVSTSKGAEGISYTNTRDICIADNETDFVNAILGLLRDREQAVSISREGFKLVEQQYDWNIIGTELKAFLDSQ